MGPSPMGQGIKNRSLKNQSGGEIPRLTHNSMNYKGRLYGKNGSEIIPLMMDSDDVDLLEIKVMMCREIIEHLAAWFEGATLDPIKLKGMVGTVQSEFQHNA